MVTVTSPLPWGEQVSQVQVQMHWYRWPNRQMEGRRDRLTEGAGLAILTGARRWLKHRW